MNSVPGCQCTACEAIRRDRLAANSAYGRTTANPWNVIQGITVTDDTLGGPSILDGMTGFTAYQANLAANQANGWTEQPEDVDDVPAKRPPFGFAVQTEADQADPFESTTEDQMAANRRAAIQANWDDAALNRLALAVFDGEPVRAICTCGYCQYLAARAEAPAEDDAETGRIIQEATDNFRYATQVLLGRGRPSFTEQMDEAARQAQAAQDAYDAWQADIVAKVNRAEARKKRRTMYLGVFRVVCVVAFIMAFVLLMATIVRQDQKVKETCRIIPTAPVCNTSGQLE